MMLEEKTVDDSHKILCLDILRPYLQCIFHIDQVDVAVFKNRTHYVLVHGKGLDEFSKSI